MLNEEYNKYLWNCHCQGDIWNEDHVPYTFSEWLEKGCPENGGNKFDYKRIKIGYY